MVMVVATRSGFVLSGFAGPGVGCALSSCCIYRALTEATEHCGNISNVVICA